MFKFGTAVILAGGKSERMGFDKQFLKLHKERIMSSVIEKLNVFFSEIIIVTNKPVFYNGSIHKIITDEIVGKGPLSGIHIGLKNASSEFVYFIACDMPLINIDYIKYLQDIINKEDKMACITKIGEYIEPFNSFYSKNMEKTIERYLLEGKTSVHGLVKNLDCSFIEEKDARLFSPNWDMFFNLNTKEDINIYLSNILDKGL